MNGKRPPNRNQVFDSNGPGVRVRGNAQQLVEKYLAMARDAASQGDRILAENCHQHADHYQRVLNALTGRYIKPDEQLPPTGAFEDDDDGMEEEDLRDNSRDNSRDYHRYDNARSSEPRPGEGPQPDVIVTRDPGVEPQPSVAEDDRPASAPPKPERAPRRRRRPAAEPQQAEQAESSGEGRDESVPA
ncbi:DUF4167 domain-containing protein [Pararhodospirillum oryzae]|uniref:DUF4167 domain-containing protein n=1 Tax=Pararhodospirillum oryzae TaxID=478448 RepID=A0A512H8C4_9PROT|nr:hypothetical protein ROR02_18230 [Pararhodospirillum oryzae]